MGRAALAGLLLLIVVHSAYAGGYDEYATGLAANNRGDSDAAISAFTNAISATDLNPALLPVAHYGRGIAQMRKGQCAAAISDMDAALALKPDYQNAAYVRAGAKSCIGDYRGASSDFSIFIAANPTAGGFSARAFTRWHSGDFPGAAADWTQSAALDPYNAYKIVWLAMAQSRAGHVDNVQIQRLKSEIKQDEWPIPVINLYLGNLNPEGLDTAAAIRQGTNSTVEHQQCEAAYYVAEWWLSRQDVPKAKPLLDYAAEHCPDDFVEYGEAKFELNRLK